MHSTALANFNVYITLQKRGNKVKNKLKKALSFILNPRALLCVAIAWLITNGWSYIMLGVGTYFDIGWMIAVSSAYLAFLWLPISPEKIVTFAIAVALLKLLFPKDEKTLAVLTELYQKIKKIITEKRKRKETDKEKKRNASDKPTDKR